MTDCKVHIIVIDGDAQINPISTIGKLQHIASCMSESIINLNIYVEEEHVAENRHKNVVKNKNV